MKFNSVIPIEVDMPKGVYMFAPSGGDGKTYMCKLLQGMVQFGSDCAVVTYDYGAVQVVGDVEHASLVVFDRFDLYFDKYPMSYLLKLGENATVLVDMKDDVENGYYGLIAYLDYADDSISVSL